MPRVIRVNEDIMKNILVKGKDVMAFTKKMIIQIIVMMLFMNRKDLSFQ